MIGTVPVLICNVGLFLTVYQCPVVSGTDLEMTLKDELLNVSRLATVRPHSVTLVKLAFNLMSINKVDIRNQQFGVTGRWLMEWIDHRLMWRGDPRYRVVKVLTVASSKIWTPTLVNENSIDNLSAIRERSIPIRIVDSGLVTFNPPGILVTSCEVKVSKFPFDTQVCSIEVTSLGYSVMELDLGVQDPDVVLTNFQPNGEWDLIDLWSQTSRFKEERFTYAKVSFFFRLRRRPLYYCMTMMLPVMVNSLLVPLVFLLPHDAGEKISYCLTALLAYVVLLTIVSGDLPAASDTFSLLGLFISLVLLMSGLSVVLAIHSLSIFHRSPQQPISDRTARLTRSVLRILKPKFKKPRSSAVSPSSLAKEMENMSRKNNGSSMMDSFTAMTDRVLDPMGIKVTPDVTSMVSGSAEEMTWKLVARTYDAFFLRLYFFIIVGSCLAFALAIAL